MNVVDILTNLLNFANWAAVNIPWELIVASGVLSPILLAVKKWMHIQSEKVMMSLVLLFGAIGSTVLYLTTTVSTDPSVIAAQSLAISAMSQPFYYLIVKPASKWLNTELAKAAAFDAEVKSAAIPADGLPVSNQQ